MKRRAFLVGSAAVATSVAAGCTSAGGGGGGGVTRTDTIEMTESKFEPLKAAVDPGTTVEWVNKDGYAHTVTAATFHDTANSWSLDTEVSGGGNVEHTFEESGVYEYYCTIHGKSTMCGAVLVGEVSLDASLPCGGGGGGGAYG